LDLNKALKAQQDSLLGYGKEFKPPNVYKTIFGLHSLWLHKEAILTNRSKWSLVKIYKDE
jgi:hypothetical protein